MGILVLKRLFIVIIMFRLFIEESGRDNEKIVLHFTRTIQCPMIHGRVHLT